MTDHVANAVIRAKNILKNCEAGILHPMEARCRLNAIEKEFPQDIFIKTHMCECGRLSVEIWRKVQ